MKMTLHKYIIIKKKKANTAWIKFGVFVSNIICTINIAQLEKSRDDTLPWIYRVCYAIEDHEFIHRNMYNLTHVCTTDKYTNIQKIHFQTQIMHIKHLK